MLRREKRHQRMHRALARGDGVRVAGNEREAPARAVVQQNAGAVRDLAAPEPVRQAGDVAADVAGRVGDDERRGLADLLVDRARGDPVLRVQWIEGAAPVPRVIGAEEPGQRVLDEPRVADVREAVGKRELLRLDREMDRLRRSPREGAHVVLRENVDHLEHHERLRRRRGRVDHEVAVRRRDGLGELRGVGGEVRGVEQAAVRAGVPDEAGREVALVQRARTLLRDRAQRAAEVRLHQDLAGAGRAAVREIHAGGRRIAAESVCAPASNQPAAFSVTGNPPSA